MHRVFFAALALMTTAFAKDEPVFAGVDANYSLGMEKEGRSWKWDGQPVDLFKGMAAQGVRGFRVRLWTGDDGQNGKNYATDVVKRALAAGLEPYLVIFLSEDWADLMKQPVPAIWKDLDLPKRAEAVRAYSRDVVMHFRRAGLRSHLYEIGNEIDYGICGVYPGKSTKKTAASLAKACWPQAAELIRASQQGVLEADPDAKFLLHISHWWDVDFCLGFFQFMLGHDVRVDYAGLSYFPSSNIGGSLEMEQFGAVVRALHAAIDRPIIVPESGYPGTADFKGQFSRWKKATPGYPLTPEGQRRWLSDFLDFCAHEPAIDSVYYWSPEWCGEGMWTAFALFDLAGDARPAWAAYAKSRAERPAPKTWRYFEIRSGNLYPVPIEEARRRAAPILVTELKTAGRVNTNYIKAITARELLVDGYRVNLRASLSGNLDLGLTENAPLTPWKKQIAVIDAAKERVVIFAHDPDAPFVAEILAAAKAREIEIVIHDLAPDQALKFGQTAGATSPTVESE